jgi:hypothetical protein
MNFQANQMGGETNRGQSAKIKTVVVMTRACSFALPRLKEHYFRKAAGHNAGMALILMLFVCIVFLMVFFLNAEKCWLTDKPTEIITRASKKTIAPLSLKELIIPLSPEMCWAIWLTGSGGLSGCDAYFRHQRYGFMKAHINRFFPVLIPVVIADKKMHPFALRISFRSIAQKPDCL